MQVEFGLPDLESRAQIFQIHTRTMNCERDIRFELLARLCPNSTGADIRSVCTEAGMFAIRARRKTVTEKDFLESVNKVSISQCYPTNCLLGVFLQCNTCSSVEYVVQDLMCGNCDVQVIKGYQKFSATPKYMVYN